MVGISGRASRLKRLPRTRRATSPPPCYEKLTAIKRNEKRIAFGEFGRCERCGGTINDDRLEAILDSEWHYCAACASKPTTARATTEIGEQIEQPPQLLAAGTTDGILGR